jgi:5-methylcytosine-specific restriction endonuclease McrA
LCGFVPVHSCQLDVDHIDGNRNNNDLANLQTLCANCHRLKTKLNKDYLKK